MLRYRVAMASRDLIDKAGTALVEAAGAGAELILFGSYARGESDSDFDFLVIEPTVEDHFGESVRLAKLVGELGVPADVVVASKDHVREWGALPGTMIHDALSEGKVVVAEPRSGDHPLELRTIAVDLGSAAQSDLDGFTPLPCGHGSSRD